MEDIYAMWKYLLENSAYAFSGPFAKMVTPMSSEFLPQINATRCIGCELCVKLCPNHVLTMFNNVATVTQTQACEYTGACQEICPTEAISLIYEIVLSTK